MRFLLEPQNASLIITPALEELRDGKVDYRGQVVWCRPTPRRRRGFYTGEGVGPITQVEKVRLRQARGETAHTQQYYIKINTHSHTHSHRAVLWNNSAQGEAIKTRCLMWAERVGGLESVTKRTLLPWWLMGRGRACSTSSRVEVLRWTHFFRRGRELVLLRAEWRSREARWRWNRKRFPVRTCLWGKHNSRGRTQG